jgi:hypothetical protein
MLNDRNTKGTFSEEEINGLKVKVLPNQSLHKTLKQDTTSKRGHKIKKKIIYITSNINMS